MHLPMEVHSIPKQLEKHQLRWRVVYLKSLSPPVIKRLLSLSHMVLESNGLPFWFVCEEEAQRKASTCEKLTIQRLIRWTVDAVKMGRFKELPDKVTLALLHAITMQTLQRSR